MEIIATVGTAIMSAGETIGSTIGAFLGASGAPMNLAAGTAIDGVAAGAASGGFSLGSTALSVLQGAAGVGSMLTAIGTGQQTAASYRDQAAVADAEGTNEQIKGLQRQTEMKRQLAKVLGENDVAFAAAGVDIGAGIAAEGRQTAETRAASELTVDRSIVDARVAMQRARAAGYRRMASSAETSGWIGAATKGVDLVSSMIKRG